MKTINFLTVLAGLALLSACGSQTARDSITSSITGAASSGNMTNYSGNMTNYSGNINNKPNAPTHLVELNGAGGAVPSQSFAVGNGTIKRTSTTLRVKVTALPAPNLTLNGFHNWAFPYGCLRLRVTVNGVQHTTEILKVDGASQSGTSVCANAPSSQLLDFSDAMTGNGDPVVTVSNPYYDNCRYTWPLNYGCSMSPVFVTHIVNADLQIETDGFYMAD